MIRLKESIQVRKNINFVFDYTSDFSRIQEWDPGVISSKAVEPGRTGVGSVYDLKLKFGFFRPKIQYRVVEYQPNAKLVLKGRAESFTAMDTIQFQADNTGTRIDYQADIEFSGVGKYLEPCLVPILKQTGKDAIQGLERVLDHGTSAPFGREWFRSGSNGLDWLADHAIVPGMLMFSRFGYDLSKRFWTEPKTSLYGKQVVLTGGTSGIGKAAAFKIAEKQAFLTIVARNRKKAEQVQQDIIEKTGNPNVDFLIADLSLMKDIRQAATRLCHTKKKIDVLINNAGALFNERQKTPEGVEFTFATDLLGVFYLTMLLKPALARSNGARIISVSSGGMYTQKIDVLDLENRRGEYKGAKAYARAKRGIVILTQIWAQAFRKDGITVHAMHPGWVNTPGIQGALPKFYQGVNKMLRTPEQGADTIVWLAGSARAGQSTGRFWLDRRPHETAVLPGTAESEQERQGLWDQLNAFVSQRLGMPGI
ncbi:MAG: SDR family NAD(P)-dependent oxidoreductase [Desulfobacter sp.]|nr:MAG: SDR family NAD(P)-dependent oxidoreductase [Desulfobacter sp.]